MVTIKIGNEQRSTKDNYESWLNDQIRNRRKSGQSLSVEVNIECDARLLLVAADHDLGGGGSSRSYSYTETQILDLWLEKGLTEKGFKTGNLISFLKQLRKLISC